MIAHAADSVAVANAKSLLGVFNDVILFPLITLLLACAFIYFLYGVFLYVKDSKDQGARTTGRQHMLWGVVGITVMVSALTILTVAARTVGIEEAPILDIRR